MKEPFGHNKLRTSCPLSLVFEEGKCGMDGKILAKHSPASTNTRMKLPRQLAYMVYFASIKIPTQIAIKLLHSYNKGQLGVGCESCVESESKRAFRRGVGH